MNTEPRTILAVDPGSAKCGVAIVTGPPLATVERAVVPTQELVVAISQRLRNGHDIAAIVIGDGTGSKVLAKAIRAAFPDRSVETVDETGTTLLARDRYRREHPPRSLLKRLLPAGLREPEEAYDDYVAVILAERWLARVDDAG